MTEFKGSIAGMSRDMTDNGIEVRLRVSEPEKARAVSELTGCELTVSLKKYRPKRSLDANAYLWVLIDKLAAATGQKRADIYRNAIRDIGGVSDIVCALERTVDKLCEMWSGKGLGWQAEVTESQIKGCKNVTLYYGSSTYNSEQMSRLIDNVVQDCEAVGVETLTPAELKMIKENWRSKE